MTDYITRHRRDQLHETTKHRDCLLLVMRRFRESQLSRGITEQQFAVMFGLTIGQMHRLIGSHNEYRQERIKH